MTACFKSVALFGSELRWRRNQDSPQYRVGSGLAGGGQPRYRGDSGGVPGDWPAVHSSDSGIGCDLEKLDNSRRQSRLLLHDFPDDSQASELQ